MIGVSDAKSRPALDGLYQQLLSRGVDYFLPGSRLELASGVPLSAQTLFRTNSPNELSFQWLGNQYTISGAGEFTDHERRILRSICRFLSTRYELLFESETTPPALPVFGQTEDRYVSTFLDPRVFKDARSAADLPDRISAAIDVLRISMLSSYEDKRISTGVLLFGGMPDACHSLPNRPADALPYASELTSIRSFHRICDGLRTIAVVDERGYMVEVVDIEEWAKPFSTMDLPVPAADRYRTHSQATLCGGHICLVLTPNGEIKVFGEGVQLFNFFEGRWRLTDTASKYQRWESAIGQGDLAARLFAAGLNLAEARRGGMFVIPDNPEDILGLVSGFDLLESAPHERHGGKNQLNYLLRNTRVTELATAVLESIAQIDGSVVLDRDSTLLAFGAILRHRLPSDHGEISEGGRTAAAIGASQFGSVLMISEGGQLSFYQKGHCIWTM
ncbi:MAG: hypothetical protein JWN34_973 [Bryobacterales bacterium]|jgi:hypothetical protein|nr:hypothetical protein [Bryobacterales bacterium]